jgi:large subunit ribosomal protein L35
MPKMKTNKSAAKRFTKTKSGKFKAKKAFGAHLLTNKSSKRRRNFRQPAVMSKSDVGRIKAMLPYA